MAKGKKYRKWYEQHKEERGIIPKFPILEENKPLVVKKEATIPVLKHPVHGYFIYECERCGTIYKMYLDKGLEDRVADTLYPEKHKPVPFTIHCKNCADLAEILGRNDYYGLCRHILWGIGDSDEYEELPEGASYFKNDENYDCGIPVYGISYRNRSALLRSMM